MPLKIRAAPHSSAALLPMLLGGINGKPLIVRVYTSVLTAYRDAEPGEFSSHPDAQYNKAQNEKKYVELFGAALASAGMPNHAIVDTGRSGKPGGRLEWGDWCNVINSGFGRRPTSSTGSTLTDAFVWVKPGGESDGTSDSSAVRYDSFCGKADAFKPSPEAGQWNQAFFEQLLKNANPAF